jgi:hypothetical protein
MRKNVYLSPASKYNGCINNDVPLPVIRNSSKIFLRLAIAGLFCIVITSLICLGMMIV